MLDDQGQHLEEPTSLTTVATTTILYVKAWQSMVHWLVSENGIEQEKCDEKATVRRRSAGSRSTASRTTIAETRTCILYRRTQIRGGPV